MIFVPIGGDDSFLPMIFLVQVRVFLLSKQDHKNSAMDRQELTVDQSRKPGSISRAVAGVSLWRCDRRWNAETANQVLGVAKGKKTLQKSLSLSGRAVFL